MTKQWYFSNLSTYIYLLFIIDFDKNKKFFQIKAFSQTEEILT